MNPNEENTVGGYRYVLGIETSCDETAAAVVQDGRKVLSNVIASQIAVHRPYGGVVPEIAARKHIESIDYITDEALTQAGVSLAQMDAVAVSHCPGLAGALLVGLSFAKALAFAQQKPLIGVNHIEGHICSNYLNSDWEPPYICLVVAGGHTYLAQVQDYGQYLVLGRTLDDAAGEAFDKIARTLGLPYPGGPQIDQIARAGNPKAIHFPRAATEGVFDFSFSGLKSAVLQYLHHAAQKKETVSVPDVAAAFQQAVVEVLVARALAACEKTGIKKIALAGGVASNTALRRAMEEACAAHALQLHMPLPIFCTDNAAMVACCGFFGLRSGKRHGYRLDACPGMEPIGVPG